MPSSTAASYSLFLKKSCPTCELIGPVAKLLSEHLGSRLSVYIQDDMSFLEGIAQRIDDGELEQSYRQNIEIVPTLIRHDEDEQRIVGWDKQQWQEFTGIPELGAELIDFKPGCGSLTQDPGMAEKLATKFDSQKLKARRIQLADAEDEMEACFDRGWSDGLPVVPPTPVRVMRMLAGTELEADELIGIVPPDNIPCSVEKVAINAVMAGCKPEYFPTVLAATEGMIEEDAKLYGAQTATNMSTPLLILNGPVTRELGANAGRNVFGSGNRPNATIGRAIRLVCRNIGGEIPDETDVATHGQPGKYTFCFAENEDESPWTPFHTDYGFKADQSAVSIVGGASSPHNVFTYGCEHGEEVLEHFIGAVTALGNNNIIFASGPLLVFSPEHAYMLDRDGFGKDDIRQYIFEKGRIPLSRFVQKTVNGLHHRRSNWFSTVNDPDHIGVADRVEDIMIAVAGGAGIHSLFIPTSFSLRPIVKLIG